VKKIVVEEGKVLKLSYPGNFFFGDGEQARATCSLGKLRELRSRQYVTLSPPLGDHLGAWQVALVYACRTVLLHLSPRFLCNPPETMAVGLYSFLSRCQHH
jgi:hypothetical protein